MKALLQRLTRHGTLIELSWRDGLWVVLWVSEGVKFEATDCDLEAALSAVWVNAAVHWASTA